MENEPFILQMVIFYGYSLPEGIYPNYKPRPGCGCHGFPHHLSLEIRYRVPVVGGRGRAASKMSPGWPCVPHNGGLGG